MSLSWKPIKRGPIYCSPACGGGCSHSQFLRAKSEAKALVMVMGIGWKPHVWENLGWHYSVIKDGLDLSIYPPSHGGNLYWASFEGKFTASHVTPHKALALVIKQMEASLRSLQENLKRIQK